MEALSVLNLPWCITSLLQQNLCTSLPDVQDFETMACDRHCECDFRHNVKVFGLQLQSQQQPYFSTIFYNNKNPKEKRAPIVENLTYKCDQLLKYHSLIGQYKGYPLFCRKGN
ncbi:hypothetical protein V8G54_000393 [Vigna mungo]|uniref:Uncharacterized protein n=1 Tax=Vigna mungo TaxID=3915 RepID=A0AAQ3S783_VIGMU